MSVTPLHFTSSCIQVVCESNGCLPCSTGYLLVEFYSDASISGPGFKLSFTAAPEPAPISCPAGQRIVTFFIRTGQADIYDLGWMMLPDGTDLKKADAKAVLVGGGYLPIEAAEVGDAVSTAALEAGDTLAVLVRDYRTWSVATEQHCLAPGKYILVLLATNTTSWDGSSVTVAVPEKTLVSAQQMQAGKTFTSTTFELPTPSDSSVANKVASRPRGGTFGFQADVIISGEFSGEDFRGVALGVVQTVVARAVGSITQDIVVTNVKNGSQSASGRRLLDVADVEPYSVHAKAAANTAARSKRAAELVKFHNKVGAGAKSAASSSISTIAIRQRGKQHVATVHTTVSSTSKKLLQDKSTTYPGAIISIKVVGKLSVMQYMLRIMVESTVPCLHPTQATNTGPVLVASDTTWLCRMLVFKIGNSSGGCGKGCFPLTI
jgi:hypothetical protein